MPTPDSTHASSKRPSPTDVLTVAFAAALALPLVVLLATGPSHLDDNNPPARWPTLADPWYAIPRRVDVAFERTFGLRPLLVAAYHRLFVLGLGAPALVPGAGAGAPKRQVLPGAQAELFYVLDGTEPHRAARPWPSELRDAWRTELVARSSWFAKQGVHYLVVIAPDKQSLYDEALPDWARRVGAPWLDALVDDLEDSGVQVVDVRRALAAGKSTARVYLRTDSHWTGFGACLAATEVLARLQRPRPSCAPVTTSRRAGGDLAALLGLRSTLADDAVEPVAAATPAPDGRAVLAGDSFADALAQPLHAGFLVLGRVDSDGLDAVAALRERPDVVIDELVERKLGAAPLPASVPGG